MSSLKVTFERNGRIVKRGSAFRSFNIPAGLSLQLATDAFLDALLDERDTFPGGTGDTPRAPNGYGVPGMYWLLGTLDRLAELDLRPAGPSLGCIDRKMPSVGSKPDTAGVPGMLLVVVEPWGELFDEDCIPAYTARESSRGLGLFR